MKAAPGKTALLILTVLVALAGILLSSCGDVHEHVWGPYEPYIESNCYIVGQDRSVCSVCGAVKYRDVPSQHTYGDAVIDIMKGEKVFSCSACGFETTERITSDDLGVPAIFLSCDLSKGAVATAEVYADREGGSAECTARVTPLDAPKGKSNYLLEVIDGHGNPVSLALAGDAVESSFYLDGCGDDPTFSIAAVSKILYYEAVSKSSGEIKIVALYDDGGFCGVYTIGAARKFASFSDEYEAVFTSTEDTNVTELWTTSNTLEGFEKKFKKGADEDALISSFNNMSRYTAGSYGYYLTAGLPEFVDLDGAMSFMLYTLFTGDADHVTERVAWVTKDGETWAPVPTVFTFGPTEDAIDPNGDYNALWEKLDDYYAAELNARWAQYREYLFTREHVSRAFSTLSSQLTPELLSAEREKWNTKEDGGAIERILDYIEEHAEELDGYFR